MGGFQKLSKKPVNHHNLTLDTRLSEKTTIPTPAIFLLTHCGLVDLRNGPFLTPY